MLLEALRSQDQYLAGSFLMFLSLSQRFSACSFRICCWPLWILAYGLRAGRRNDARALRFPAPFEPHAGETLTPEQERFYRASQWQIMWWKLKRHRIAVIAGAILLLFYASTLVSEFIAPFDLHTRDTSHIYARRSACACSTRAISSARSSTATACDSTCRRGSARTRTTQARCFACASSAWATTTSSGA